MAYLGNTLINGSLRCLNKAYFNDLSIGNDVEIAGKTTTNQLWVNSSNNPNSLSSTNSSTGNIPVIIGNPTGRHIAIDADEIAGKKGVTSVDSLWINYGGGTVYLSTGSQVYADNGTLYAPRLGTSTKYIPNAYITTLASATNNVTTLNASTGTVQDLEVKNILKSFKWDISNVANLANDFMVAPTIEIATDGKVSVSKSGSDYIFTFADSNTITSDEFAGCKWLDGSKVRFTTKINDKLFSDIYGTVTGNMNTTSGRLAVKTSLTDNDLTGISMNTPYDAVGSTIMLYAITKTGDTNIYPVGIHMTAYGTNNSYYIDMYGGNSPSSSGTPAQPVFRIGNLGGITYNEQTLPAQWGVYTYNGYFEGAIVAKEGKIGEWIIDSEKIYTGTWGTANSAMMSPGTTSTDGNKSIGGSDSINGWTFTSGANFGVNKDGSLYANKGKIGNWIIETDRLHIGDFGGSTSVVLSTGITSTTDIGGSGTRTSQNALTWVFTAGNKFGVTNNGVLYANDVNVTGAVNASTLHVGSSNSTNHLIYENSTIDLQTDWLRFDSSTSTVIIGKDNAPRVNIDGQSMYLKDMNNDTYFIVGDKRTNGYYEFTVSNPDIVQGSSSYIETSCNIDENYSVIVMDENGNDIGYTSITHVTTAYGVISRIVANYETYQKTFKIAYTTSSGVYGIQFGYASYISPSIGAFSSCFSLKGSSSGSCSFTEGKNTEASGAMSHAEGNSTEASGASSHAEGIYTISSGKSSHAEGWRGVASGNGSHSEGYFTTASANYSHAEGYYTTASANASHAEGSESSAQNEGSHAEGRTTIASGLYSHSEGCNTNASKIASHSEGWETSASGNYSHSEGYYTTASASVSHSQGSHTVASGYASHSSGLYTYATEYVQTTIGKYNVVTTSTNSSGDTIYNAGSNNAFIIGNGEDENNRSNALTVDWDGNLSCAGKVNNVDLYCISTEGTLASSNYQTAIGKYNVEDTNNAYAFIIGNGTDNNNRSNALTVDWTGSVRSLASNVSMTSTPSSDTWIPHYNLNDSSGYSYGKIQGDFLANGEVGITLQTNRTINNTYYQNHLSLHIKNDGTPAVTVGHPEKWRIALGVNIKTFNQNITTDAYGQCSVPSSLTSKTILDVRTGNYQYGAFLIGSTNIRVFKISAIPLDWAKNVSVPLIFTYID